MLMDRSRRNVFILVVCQALYMTGTSLMISTSPLVGYGLAEDKGFATLAISTHHIGVMLATLPASLLMGRIGRRPAFLLASLLGIAGAALSGTAIMAADFAMFCVGTFVIGTFNGFAVFYRFAAADTASPEFRPTAISLVMTGGLFAAFLGPEIAKITREMLAPVTFAASYYALIGVYLLNALLIAGVDIPRPVKQPGEGSGRPLLEILRQPRCMAAVVAAFVSYAVMSLLMTSAPLAMMVCGFGFNESATAIQLHIIGMFAPSFVTGRFVKRFGAPKVIVAGVGVNLVCVGVHLAGITFAHFWLGMLLLGVGWNLMFVGATTLLTETHTPLERAKVQGFNDFLVFATVAVSAFASGQVIEGFGWQTINIGVLLPLALALVLVGFVAWKVPASQELPRAG